MRTHRAPPDPSVKRSERQRGRSLERSKAIAAATVVKHHNESKHRSGK